MLYKKDIEKSNKKIIRRRPIKYSRLNPLGISINFNLRLSQNNNSMANAKIKSLNIILNNQAGFVDDFW